ncbi:MAG TPA: hypothetical protein VES58_05165 [Syntrophobacteria bacterium]|nr:hypothetical protein [Syntrophobacteria bacterium]
MDTAGTFRDVEALTRRVMINLYKKRIREARLNPARLKGTWAEASGILAEHFGRFSRVMDQNASKLLALYQIALDEIREDKV